MRQQDFDNDDYQGGVRDPTERPVSASVPEWHQDATAATTALSRRVLQHRDLEAILVNLKADGVVPPTTSLAQLRAALEEHAGLHEVLVGRPDDENGLELASRPVKRFVLGDATPEEVALSLRPRSYLSHHTALRLHGLLARFGSRVYANQEQSSKPPSTGRLTQAGIDRAFANAPRVSTYILRYGGSDLILLAGKQTGNYAVEPLEISPAITVPVTSVPRTLVDVAVRPVYAGGAREVMNAYRAAVHGVEVAVLVRKICEVLNALDHLYPYHQAIGFYLARAGVPRDQLAQLTARGVEHDFYLEHQMDGSVLDPDWRVFVPNQLANG